MSVHLYSLACGQGYFFLGPEEAAAAVGVSEGSVLRGLAGVGVVVMAVFAAFRGGVRSVLMDGMADEVGGGAEVGSIFALVRGRGGWLDRTGEIGGRPWCVDEGTRGFMVWVVGNWGSAAACSCRLACCEYAWPIPLYMGGRAC